MIHAQYQMKNRNNHLQIFVYTDLGNTNNGDIKRLFDMYFINYYQGRKQVKWKSKYYWVYSILIPKDLPRYKEIIDYINQNQIDLGILNLAQFLPPR